MTFGRDRQLAEVNTGGRDMCCEQSTLMEVRHSTRIPFLYLSPKPLTHIPVSKLYFISCRWRLFSVGIRELVGSDPSQPVLLPTYTYL